MSLNKSTVFTMIGPAHDASQVVVENPPFSRLEYDGNGNPVGVPALGAQTLFEQLPGTSITATTDKYGVVGGTPTVNIQRSDTGGVILTSKGSPADGDMIWYAGDANTAFAAKVTPSSQFRFQAALRFGTAAANTMFASFGLNESVTSPNPTLSTGDHALFLYDPTGEITGFPPEARKFWALADSGFEAGTLNGSPTHPKLTTYQVIPGATYDLVIQIGPDLRPSYYINGTKVGSGPPLTSGSILRVFCGAELTGSPAGQADLTLHLIRVNRYIG